MLKILHVSDLHFGPPYLPKIGESLLRAIPPLEPDVAVISGDFTQRAKAEQFEAAQQFIDRFPDVPRVVIPGNHDVPLYRVKERLSEPHALYQKYISQELNTVLEMDGAVFVGLDSTAPHTSITNGRILLPQLEFCEQAFESAPRDAARIVVAHHHFAPAPDYERDQTMPQGKRALRKFLDLEVDLILGGHLHRAYIGNSLDLLPDKSRRHQGIIIVQCGTTTSRRGRARERERNSFNFLTIDAEMIDISHHMYFDDTDNFEAISYHRFPRRGTRISEES